MNFPRPVVVIFGAGATRGAFEGEGSSPPPPVDKDFFDIAGQLKGHGTESLARRVLKSVWDIYSEVRGISLERYYRDIETREAVGPFVKPPNQPMRWSKRRADLEELIRRVYIHTTCDTSSPVFKPKTSDVHRRILNHLKSGDTIVTFNYDLAIEEAFPVPCKIWTPIDGYGLNVHGKTRGWSKKWIEAHNEAEDLAFTTSVPLLKLHGSLNWRLYGNKQIRIKDRPYVVRGNTTEDVSILPPGWKKRIERKPYSTFWRIAGNRLQHCKTIAILGYSLPETDLIAQSLFAEVIRARAARGPKKHLRELHLAEPNEQIKERFIRLFSPALGSSGTVFKYAGIQEFAKGLSSPAPTT